MARKTMSRGDNRRRAMTWDGSRFLRASLDLMQFHCSTGTATGTNDRGAFRSPVLRRAGCRGGRRPPRPHGRRPNTSEGQGFGPRVRLQPDEECADRVAGSGFHVAAPRAASLPRRTRIEQVLQEERRQIVAAAQAGLLVDRAALLSHGGFGYLPHPADLLVAQSLEELPRDLLLGR